MQIVVPKPAPEALLDPPDPEDALLDPPDPEDALLDEVELLVELDVARVGHIDWVPGEVPALAHVMVPVSQTSPWPSPQSVSLTQALPTGPVWAAQPPPPPDPPLPLPLCELVQPSGASRPMERPEDERMKRSRPRIEARFMALRWLSSARSAASSTSWQEAVQPPAERIDRATCARANSSV
jgi:hypothetical protein